MNDRRDKVLLLGFADDLEKVVMGLHETPPITRISEDASDDDIPQAADVIIYILSADTSYSTQLHSLFAYVHDRVAAREEYLLSIEPLDLAKTIFPEVSHIPSLSIHDLRSKLRDL